MAGKGLDGGLLRVLVPSAISEFSAMNPKSNVAPREREPTRSASTSSREPPPPRSPPRPGPGAIEHVAVVVDAGHVMAGCRQWNGDAAGPDGQLQDAAADAIGQRPVEVDVARVVGQVEIVEARQGGCRRGSSAAEAHERRTQVPAWRRTASALIASSASRLAAIAVVSAWS